LINEHLSFIVVERFIGCVTFLHVSTSDGEGNKAHEVLLYFLESTSDDDHCERNDCGISAGRRDSRYLLDAGSEQEEQIGGSRELG